MAHIYSRNQYNYMRNGGINNVRNPLPLEVNSNSNSIPSDVPPKPPTKEEPNNNNSSQQTHSNLNSNSNVPFNVNGLLNFMNSTTGAIDKDKLIILFLIYLLFKEGSNLKLLLALGYMRL